MRLRFAVAALLLISSPSLAADIALHWDDCGAAGTSLKTFACNTNSGAATMVVSFIPPPGIADFDAAEASLQVTFPSGSPAPSWWNFSSCRPVTALTASGNFVAGPFTCVSPWSGNSAGGLIWSPAFYSPWSGRLQVAWAMPLADVVALDPNTEYYAFKIILNYAKTVGTGACSGCEVPAGIYLRQVNLDSYAGTDATLVPPVETRSDHRYYVGWQCEGSPVFDHGSIYDWPFTDCAVPVRRPSWGAIKNLYR